MRSAKSFFSGALFRKNLLRFWPLWAAYRVIWLLSLPLPMLRQLNLPELRPESGLLSIVTSDVLGSALNIGSVLTFLFAIAGAMAVWGGLYGARSGAMLGSLPVRREGLFLTGTASALAPMLAAHVLVFLVTVLAEAGNG